MSNVQEVTELDFQSQVLESDQPVLVDFWAPWCGPCRMIAPIIEQLAAENAGKAKVVKLNVDDAQNLAAGYGINSIPTIMVFKGGQVVDRFVGVQSKQRLQEALDRAI
jgi:thioredoxin 1